MDLNEWESLSLAPPLYCLLPMLSEEVFCSAPAFLSVFTKFGDLVLISGGVMHMQSAGII